LTSLLLEICESHRERRDYTRDDIMRALRGLVAVFPVYRTYIVPERDEIAPDDKRYVNYAVDTVKELRPDMDADLFEFIRDILLLRVRGPLEAEFVMRFQQFTGPAMAKGIEDTVFYSFNRLVSLNEVGGDPGRFGISREAFHRFCLDAQRSHPRTMLASSTHDTKRSEDVRARLNLLSEMPDEWRAAVENWSRINAKHKTAGCPDPNTEYLLYQTMLGAWPISEERIQAYMQKACREAKQQTSWLAPNEAFENAARDFISSLYRDREFLDAFESFVQPLVEPGRVNSLSQLLVKLTAPGVPDMYQGTELWTLDLVDPDNRRPVDYSTRRSLLAELPRLRVKEVWRRIDEGVPKLWTIYHALQVRRRRLPAFGERGVYTPLSASGEKARHLIAFLRGARVAVLAPRLVWQLRGDWAGTQIELPPGNWRNALTGKSTPGGAADVGRLLADFPTALLVKA
jgi:(1->4)-alpha-D-glucan 1-alpha-D-glucosylmutase